MTGILIFSFLFLKALLMSAVGAILNVPFCSKPFFLAELKTHNYVALSVTERKIYHSVKEAVLRAYEQAPELAVSQ